jgi:hypothetical protein
LPKAANKLHEKAELSSPTAFFTSSSCGSASSGGLRCGGKRVWAGAQLVTAFRTLLARQASSSSAAGS